MKFIRYFATLLCCGCLLAACGGNTPTCDPATDPTGCTPKPQCSGVMQDCKNGGLDGCETDTTQDANNCGACGNVCPAPTSGQAVCDNGVCSSATCGTRFQDCNNNPADGCETDTLRNVDNCGTCGKKCPGAPNGAAACSAGQCKILCQAGFLDCNGDKTDGCETNGSADISNCGSCGNVCTATAPANAVCTAGSCSTSACTAPFFTCQMGPVTSCETNLSNDLNNCGGCGIACGTVDNGTPACANSNCGILSCNQNFDNCNGVLSDGCEINLQGNVNNCGVCGNACSTQDGTPNCVSGVCGIGSCNAGFDNCNGTVADGCEINLNTNTNHCGACNNRCNLNNAAAHACVGGSCFATACNAGFENCNVTHTDGCETNLTNNVNNCSFCGNACPGQNQATGTSDATCVSSACQMSCRGENYDSNGNPVDGCEKPRGTPPGHAQATNVAGNLGSDDCFDTTITFQSAMLSDKRPHSPAPTNFNSSTGTAPDFWFIFGDGGFGCQNDYAVTFTTSGGTSANCYSISIITNVKTETHTIGGTGTVSFSSGASSYGDDTNIFFKIEKICTTANPESINYRVDFHI